mgnify:CR=1 FL=1
MNSNSYSELCRAGVDFFTMGNHTYSKKDIIEDVAFTVNQEEDNDGL